MAQRRGLHRVLARLQGRGLLGQVRHLEAGQLVAGLLEDLRLREREGTSYERLRRAGPKGHYSHHSYLM